MNKTLRVAVPILLLVGVALMIPNAAADPAVEDPLGDTVQSAVQLPGCYIAKVQTYSVVVYTAFGTVTVYGRYICV